MTCFFCGGPAHPSTGSQWSERVIACRRCAVHFWTWYRAHANRQWGGVYFYECATGRYRGANDR